MTPATTPPRPARGTNPPVIISEGKRLEAVDWEKVYGPLSYKAVGCAFCHIKDDAPMQYSLPPMNYPGMRDARVDMRLHDECHARLVKIIAGALGIHLPEESAWDR
jgi:hypothetical protein